ncbi:MULTISPECIES: BREX-2 system adenine-specific DNA-methyltransferase PglX [unclassified Streptomyces]|uniref:BREX-2 system adenine-specific DNA-methyltransferase PglX n=1 Tax=unclassified Streptomyces TaxID=2593676 RepID=UPI001F0D8F7A|nr:MULTISPECIES: BREX-2 system adenine-specific DNA-methyltransferase PglX [unclassified Streptomyces]
MEPRLAEYADDRAERIRVAGRLLNEHDRAFSLGRTAESWNSWLYGTPQISGRITQVAVAWVLGTVFVRFCEDNLLIPEPYLAGPDEERRDLAEARYAQYVEEEQDPTFRGWLERAFKEIGEGEAGKLLFNRQRNPLYQIPISHDGARALVEFWRERDEAGRLVHDFTDPLNEDGTEGWDTRFLGDLYQDLSEAARKTYALLQTPEFVEEFILDRTMGPVVREMGGRVGELKMIDPTCGSGHFVLGAFRRMVRLLAERQPGMELHARVRMALDAVHGVDINPFAVAIARFRLLMAAMAAANVRTLGEASQYDWPVHLAVGDSLIKVRQTELGILGTTGLQGELEFVTDETDKLAEFSYATEDIHEEEFKGILEQGRYDVVVGNPPYITVKDKKLNALYRDLYKSCAGKYALSVPFAERFFQLAKAGEPNGRGYGMVGQITANSFMKREFGTKLIEEYFAHKVELMEVIDTSGAYIPGHGTPTVILVGRRRAGSRRGETIRTVRSVQGEPSTPERGQEGLVWKAIKSHIDTPDHPSNRWVSVSDLNRETSFGKQPWILTDGGLEMIHRIDQAKQGRLNRDIARIGFYGIMGADDAMAAPPRAFQRINAESAAVRQLVVGDEVRDFDFAAGDLAFHPYDMNRNLSQLASFPRLARWLWPNRTELGNRATFSRGTYFGDGRPWWEWHQLPKDEAAHNWSIAFSFVSTHNHFTLDRDGKAFNRSAPLIKLRKEASKDEHLRLLGLLNSSTACFWLKQVSHNKGSTVDSQGARQSTIPFEDFYEFTGTKLQQFPLPRNYPTRLASSLESLAQEHAAVSPSALTALSVPTPTNSDFHNACAKWAACRARMIALQEELDWQVYSLYNLHPEDLRAPEAEVPELSLGERAFEIVLARRVEAGEASGEWFKRHGSTPITEMPDHWSDAYKAVVQKRIDAIENSRAIGMIERPEYKRRWATEGWDVLQERALKAWLLDRIETREYWFDENGQPTILTLNQVTDVLSRDEDFVSVAEIYAPRQELATVVSDLLSDEHVPFLAVLRYKPAALKKRADWEHVWDLQRKEDAETDEFEKRKIRDSIPVPPKYTSADFLKPSYWRARGKLDVPKERFISYATGATSGTPQLFGWAGWDHREQAQALSTYFTVHDELSAEELTPLLAGLLELQPWLTQWHNEFDGLYGGSPAAFFEGYRAAKQGELGLTDDDLRAWRPPAAARRGRRPAKG